MSNSGNKGHVDEQRPRHQERQINHVLFNDSNIIENAEISGNTTLKNKQHYSQLKLQQTQSQRYVNDVSNNEDVKNIGSLLNCCVQPYPFTFITAVKKKLALDAEHDRACIKLLNSGSSDALLIPSAQIDSRVGEISNRHEETIRTMDFIRPLKVPDLKISPKTLDYSSRENTLQRNVMHKNENITTKNSLTDRAHRKLDFSVSSHCGGATAATLLTNEEKPSTKKKEFIRENSRERENRTKRIRRDDSNSCKGDGELSQDSGKRMKNLKPIPRKDIASTSDSSTSKFVTKNERGLSSHRENELIGQKKAKTKISSNNSIGRKDDGRKPRPNSYSMKILRDRSVDNRACTCNDSVPDRISKTQKYNENYQNIPITPKEQLNKILDKPKASSTKIHHSLSANTSEITDGTDINTQTNSNESNSIYTELSLQQSKSKSEKLSKSSQTSSQSVTKSKCTDNFRYIDKIHRNDIPSLDVPLTNEEKTNDQEFLQHSNSSDDLTLDPRRISFRDNSYSQQEEFCNLVTPDLNLIYRPVKRKEQRTSEFLNEPTKEVVSSTKYKPQRFTQAQCNDSIPLMHPTALHMQFQAELHLFDSYNESIRQVMDVENALYNVKQEQIEQQFPLRRNEKSIDNNDLPMDYAPQVTTVPEIDGGIVNENMDGINGVKDKKLTMTTDASSDVRMAAVHTQTANDIATQTDAPKLTRHNLDKRESFRQYPGITYSRGSSNNDVPLKLSLQSLNDEFNDDIDDQLEEISLQNKTIRTMSEISLHETTSSIKTETGTEISISTRDVTCSFNKYLDLEMAQLIKDEKQMYDKIEMLFKSREKILNDRTRKLVKLEEQKRALRDTGQDSRISSVKKKQRALLLKLQQEKDEMNRLKELHKLASQERKLMLQKQRNMFNPQMSTKNILTKLKRSADCQSPRRLSGPMKGYDIRSNSSVSSLIDSDKSQLDRSNFDAKNQLSDSAPKIGDESCKSDGNTLINIQSNKLNKYPKLMEESTSNSSNVDLSQKYEIKTRKFEERMPKSDALLRLKSHHMELESKLMQARQENINQLSLPDLHDGKSESDTIVEELPKKSKMRDRDNLNVKKAQYNMESTKGNSNNKRKGMRNLKGKSTANILIENEMRSKSNVQSSDEPVKYNKRPKFERDPMDINENCSNSILEEINLNDSQNSLQALIKHSRAVKEKNYEILRDIADETEAKENILCSNRHDNNRAIGINREDGGGNLQQNLGNISTRSQVSTFTISRHSSGDSEKSYSRSVVIRSQDHQFKRPKKLEQILHAREAALATRRNCVEDWIAWHARLKAEESRIARMEEAAYKLVSATSNVLSCHDTTVSSDTSDVEGRVGMLAEKLSERRAEMAKLKREARRQAKQRLKALEANLLNQIKKYDMTIHEMRKKLDFKRGPKDDGKLAIEAKSIANFKVPEIPIKRIREIYRSSDLLRSRSESDLMTNNTCCEKNRNNNYDADYQSSSSLETKCTVGQSQQQSERLMKIQSRSTESILEEARHISLARSLHQKNSQLSIDEGSVNDLPNVDENSMGNLSSIRNKSNHNSKHSSKIHTDASHVEYLDSDMRKTIRSSSTDSIIEEITNDEHTAFSDKINFLQLNNKNLSDDINTLENDLKTLSEMMSRFSKKSDDKIRKRSNNSSSDSIKSRKSTLKDITEDLGGSSENSENVEEVLDETCELSSIMDHKDPSESKNSLVNSSQITERIISTVSLNEGHSDDKSTDDIDFKARSKEILNVIERSIISDHIKKSEINFDLTGAALEKSMQNLHKENEALSSDFNSLEGDIKSISKIISEMAENKRNSHIIMDNTSQVIPDFLPCESDNNSIVEEIIDEIVDENKSAQLEMTEHASNDEILTNSTIKNDAVDNLRCTNDNEFSHESFQMNDSMEERTLDIIDKSNSEEIKASNRTDLSSNQISTNFTISNSFGDVEVSNELIDSQISDKMYKLLNNSHVNINERIESWEKQDDIANATDISNHTADIENPAFIPYGESTNIHCEMVKTMDQTMNSKHIDTDELDDILDIIEKENKKENNTNIILAQVPDELQLKIHDESLTSSVNNELNITADVEPVLQKLTEILQSVERNIAKRTQDRELVMHQKQFICENIIESDNDVISNDLSVPNTLMLNDESPNLQSQNNEEISPVVEVMNNSNATTEFNIIKEPEYEDISEESLEVSEIFDKSAPIKSGGQKSNRIPEKYEAIAKTDDVLRILDQITKQSALKVVRQSNQHLQDVQVTVQVFGEISPDHNNEHATNFPLESIEVNEESRMIFENKRAEPDGSNQLHDEIQPSVHVLCNDTNGDVSSESSQDADTPRGVSEIDLDSPRDQNDSRLDIDILDDDLLTSVTEKSDDTKAKFQQDGTIISSERDIEIMIEKLRASLDQPGLEVAELDARLLRLEQLQIELQIKKLEAEEVAFYVREIPNKPPPPYTPPGVGSLSSPEPSPTLLRAVVPSNIDELTTFTERATFLIYNAKLSGANIMSLEAPSEICHLNKDTNGIAKKDRKIYNTFLFDLCKETIAEVFRSEYEKPGPSWTKPSVKTKPVMKLPKTCDDLNEYVNKEVATLFGFKTKLQRENMVMRWSRKRRDRVDELLAREAQAEEDEWTKFHHDELAVKNELTVAILDTLIFETTNIVKAAYAKKQKMVT